MIRASLMIILVMKCMETGSAIENDVIKKVTSLEFPFEVNRVDAKTFLNIEVEPTNLLEIQCDVQMQKQGVCSIKHKNIDVCSGVSCGHGRECVKNKAGIVVCECSKICAPPGNVMKVCSDQNETFNNMCDLYRERCLCQKRSWKCQNGEHANIHLQYLGKCMKFNESMCNHKRMQKLGVQTIQWVKGVIQKYATTIASKPDTWVKDMEEELDEPTKSLYPILYKLCGHMKEVGSEDHFVVSEVNISRLELIGVTSKFISGQPCILTLLNDCDLNSDDVISVSEFEACLGVDKMEIFKFCWI